MKKLRCNRNQTLVTNRPMIWDRGFFIQMEFLKVYQIYFNEDQKSLLEPEFISLLNTDCTVYFESSVIKKLIENQNHFDCEYFGVVSYKLREKIGSVMQERWKTMPNIANHSLKTFSPHLFKLELLKHRPDVMSFQRHVGHDTVSYADNFHPGFSQLFAKIMRSIGYNWNPECIKDVFYCNYFVAKNSVYDDFVHKMLIPAMSVMDGMPELMNNSRYPHPLPSELQKKFGVPHYTYHPFICERMFSFYAHVNKLNCLHY